MKKYLCFLILLISSISACKKDEPIGGTSVETMSGEWWVQLDGEGDYYKMITYNTADNSTTQMWLDASGFWAQSGQQVNAKVNVNLTDLTFSADKSPNAGEYPEPITLTVSGGKIVKNGTVGPVSKDVTDSIAFNIVFSDDPTTTYKFTGYHRTKFPDDDH